MPFFRWEDMDRKNLIHHTDSESSMIEGETITLNRSVMPPGKRTRPHQHGCEQLIHILEGRAWVKVGEEERVLGAGEVAHMPRGVEHEMRNAGEGNLVYLSFKNRSEDWPPRGDTT